MVIDIITLFPDFFKTVFESSIIRRAQDKLLVKINIHNLRNWAIDKRGTVDGRPYGGGVGMILRPEPIFEAVKSLKQKKSYIILLSASGNKFNQEKAIKFSKLNHLILICGHYEGVDQRIVDHLIDEEISIGDYILTGGEIPAMVLVDSIVRLIPKVLEKPEAVEKESFTKNVMNQSLLEYPHYTRPEIYNKMKVPSVLLSGNHKQIDIWRLQESLKKTKKVRPDLLKPVE